MTTTPAHPGIPAPPKGEFYFPTPAIPNRVIKMEDDIMERVCRLLFEGKLVEKVCSRGHETDRQTAKDTHTHACTENRLTSFLRSLCRRRTQRSVRRCGAASLRALG